MTTVAKTDKVLGPGVTVYEGARRYKPGSLEAALPERFKDKKHDTLREKMFKGKSVIPSKAESAKVPAKQQVSD